MTKSTFLSWLAVLLFAWPAASQCPDITLAALQNLQRADSGLKESQILDLGFDLASEFKVNESTMRRYNKCWKGNMGKALYDQIILWNTGQNQIMVLFAREEQYSSLRNAIEGRHGSASSQKGLDYYIGNQFMYRFSIQQLDGMEYHTISISFK